MTAVAFSDTATPMSRAATTAPRRRGIIRPAANASDTRPTMIDSLCRPATRCSSTSGLSTPSHCANAGSPPSFTAMRGTDHTMARNPNTHRMRNNTMPTVMLSPTMRVITSLMPKCSGPYGVVVLRQSAETSSSIGPGLTAAPSLYGSKPSRIIAPCMRYE